MAGCGGRATSCVEAVWTRCEEKPLYCENSGKLEQAFGEDVDALCLSMFKRHFFNTLNDVFLLWASLNVVRQLDLIFVGSCQLELLCVCVFLDDLGVHGLKTHTENQFT